MTRRLLILFCLLISGFAQAEIRPFQANSLQEIERGQKGHPFILTFWSATCVHCPTELRALSALLRQYPTLRLVLVSADTPAESAELARLTQDYGLEKQPQWVFADAQPERLRFAVDRKWFGELPRTYFYNRQHQREGRSGVVPAEQLERWVAEHVK